jgi:hypothetical protein
MCYKVVKFGRLFDQLMQLIGQPIDARDWSVNSLGLAVIAKDGTVRL